MASRNDPSPPEFVFVTKKGLATLTHGLQVYVDPLAAVIFAATVMRPPVDGIRTPSLIGSPTVSFGKSARVQRAVDPLAVQVNCCDSTDSIIAGAAVKSTTTSCSSTSFTNGLKTKVISVPGLTTESRRGASDCIPTLAAAAEDTSINTSRARDRCISYL